MPVTGRGRASKTQHPRDPALVQVQQQREAMLEQSLPAPYSSCRTTTSTSCSASAPASWLPLKKDEDEVPESSTERKSKSAPRIFCGRSHRWPLMLTRRPISTRARLALATIPCALRSRRPHVRQLVQIRDCGRATHQACYVSVRM
jgi:hypothetical protein